MRLVLLLVLTSIAKVHANALEYPGPQPGTATGTITDERMVLANEAMHCEWERCSGRVGSLTITDRRNNRTLHLAGGHMPRVVISADQTVDLAELTPVGSFRLGPIDGDANATRLEERCAGRRLTATFRDVDSGLEMDWSVELRDGSNYVVQTLELRARHDTRIDALTFLDAMIPGARQVGEVSGSVIVCGQIFVALEHPLAENVLVEGSCVRCVLPRGNTLRAGRPWRHSSVIGVVPTGQLRRGFLYYLERRRTHPYRPFLHYNSWYHLNIGRQDNHMTEAECLQAIERLGRELVERRGVKLDAFVWDDGWDDFNSLWGFHEDFPGGFAETKEAAAKYGAVQGVWMSPWGGYGEPKRKRLEFGEAQGYETNEHGFSMAGPKYAAAFRDVCLNMMRRYNVAFFKFDGMGAGNLATGACNEFAADVDAILRLTQILREENPDVFVSATVGTWPSPFWTCHADSIWRQGEDTGFHGPGNGRRRWITYRDMVAYRRIVRRGPLYPLNSVMFHGLCIGDRANPAKMSRDGKSVADEIWTMFGCGMGLQELYISPELLAQETWDELAMAAKWARANADVLVDSHWVGGDPGSLEVYGFASWQPRKGILVLRNPAETPHSFEFRPRQGWELPLEIEATFILRRVNGAELDRKPRRVAADGALSLRLEPFEVLVLESVSGS